MQRGIQSDLYGKRRCKQNRVPLSEVHQLIRVGRYDFSLEECRCNVSKSYEHEIVIGKDEKIWTADEPVEVRFWGNSGRFLGFIVHEHDIQIDPKKIESIGKIGEPVYKKDV
jgi:hypothetical protein